MDKTKVDTAIAWSLQDRKRFPEGASLSYVDILADEVLELRERLKAALKASNKQSHRHQEALNKYLLRLKAAEEVIK